MQVHPGAIGHMPGGFGTMSAAASRTIVPLMLSHKGHDEKLQIEDMDDPAEPQRFFKLPRGRLCSLRLLLPFATANLKQDIYVKLCGSRGERFPSMVGRAQNKLTTAEFVTCHGNQYELLNDQFDSPTEGTVLSFEYELRTVVPSPADGIGQYVDFDFKINIATEDPREWHYYVYFYFVDMRHPETQGISPPLATKKRLQRPIEQSKWKSSIQIVNPGLGRASSSQSSQASFMGEFTVNPALQNKHVIPTVQPQQQQQSPSTPPQQAQVAYNSTAMMYPGQGVMQMMPMLISQEMYMGGLPQQGMMFMPPGASQMMYNPYGQMMMMTPQGAQFFVQPSQQPQPLPGTPGTMSAVSNGSAFSAPNAAASQQQTLLHPSRGSSPLHGYPQAHSPTSASSEATMTPPRTPSEAEDVMMEEGNSHAPVSNSHELPSNPRKMRTGVLSGARNSPYTKKPSSGKWSSADSSSSDSSATTLATTPGAPHLPMHTVRVGAGYAPIMTIPRLAGATDGALQGDLSVGDVVVDVTEHVEPLNAAAMETQGTPSVKHSVRLDDMNLSYALHAICYKNQGNPPTGPLEVKMNGVPVATLNVEWEQQLLEHMEDWIKDLGQGKHRSVMKQQERNEQALLNNIKHLWDNEMSPEVRRMITYFVTVALNDLEFHRKRDSYAMFVTRMDVYARLVQRKNGAFNDPEIKQAYVELWKVIQAEKHVLYNFGFKHLVALFTRTRHFDTERFKELGRLLHSYCAQHWASFNILVTLGACVPTVHERGPHKSMRKIYREIMDVERDPTVRSQIDTETIIYLFATDSYKHSIEMPSTKCCVSDARRLYTLMTKRMYRCTAHTTFNKSFTKETFDDFIAHLPSVIKPNMQIMITIHAHAVREGKDTYVCPWDTDPSQLQRTGISLLSLRQRLREVLQTDAKGVHIALYLDCCHSGLNAELDGSSSASLYDGDDDAVSNDVSPRELRQSSFEQIGASGSNQKALEKEPYGSYLTYAFANFINNLRDDSGFYAAFKHMKRYVVEKTGQSQVPVYSRFTSGDGQFRFIARREQPILRLQWPRSQRVWQLGVPFVGDHYKIFFALFSETIEGSKTINRNIKTTVMQRLGLQDEKDLEYAYKQVMLPSGRIPSRIYQYGDITTFIDEKTSLVHIRAPEQYRLFFLKMQADLSCHDQFDMKHIKAINYYCSQIFSGQKTSPKLQQAVALIQGEQNGRPKECLYAWRAKTVRRTIPHLYKKGFSDNNPAPSPGFTSSTSKSGSSRQLASSASGASSSKKHHFDSDDTHDVDSDNTCPEVEIIDLKRLVRSHHENDTLGLGPGSFDEFRYEEAIDVGFLKGSIIVAINCRRDVDRVPVCLLFRLHWNSDGHLERHLFKKLPPLQKLSYGHLHVTCLTVEGDIYCYGVNNDNQLGAKNPNSCKILKSNVLDAESTLGVGRKFVDIASGEIHNLALTNDGKVLSWGGNGSGQLGRKKTEDAREIPDLAGVKQISCGTYSSAATTLVGAPKVWGFGKAEGLLIQQHTPRTLTLPLKKGISVGAILLGTTTALLIENEEPPQFITSKENEETLEVDHYSLKFKPERKDAYVVYKTKLTLRNKYKTEVQFHFVSKVDNCLLHVETAARKEGRFYSLAPGAKEQFKLTIVPLPSVNPSASGSILISVRGNLSYSLTVPNNQIKCGQLSKELVSAFPSLLFVDQVSQEEADLVKYLRSNKLHIANYVGALASSDEALSSQQSTAGADSDNEATTLEASSSAIVSTVRERLRSLTECEESAVVYKKMKSLLKIAVMLDSVAKLNVVCRDLEIENIFLNSRDQPVLQSLKNSVTIGLKDKMSLARKNPSLRSQPPEAFALKRSSNVESMIFSFGVLMYEFLSQKRVTRSKSHLQEGIVPFEDDDPASPLWEFKYLYRACCSPTPDRRPTLQSIIDALKVHADKLKDDHKNLKDPLMRRQLRQHTAAAAAAAAEQQSKKTGYSAPSSPSTSKSSSSNKSCHPPLVHSASTGDLLSPADVAAIQKKAHAIFFGSTELHTIGPINFDRFYEQVTSTQIKLCYSGMDKFEIRKEDGEEDTILVSGGSSPGISRKLSTVRDASQSSSSSTVSSKKQHRSSSSAGAVTAGGTSGVSADSSDGIAASSSSSFIKVSKSKSKSKKSSSSSKRSTKSKKSSKQYNSADSSETKTSDSEAALAPEASSTIVTKDGEPGSDVHSDSDASDSDSDFDPAEYAASKAKAAAFVVPQQNQQQPVYYMYMPVPVMSMYAPGSAQPMIVPVGMPQPIPVAMQPAPASEVVTK